MSKLELIQIVLSYAIANLDDLIETIDRDDIPPEEAWKNLYEKLTNALKEK